MKKLVKIGTWAIGAVIVLLLIAVILLKVLFPTEKIRDLAAQQATESLGREVTIEDLNLSFWGGLGVRLQGVAVANEEGFADPQMVMIDNVDVKLRLLPLIGGEYRIDRLIVNQPQISMIKQADGTINYQLAIVDQKLPPEIAQQVPDETKAAAVAISFDRLEVNGGTLHFVDDSSNLRVDIVGFDLSSEVENPRAGYYQARGQLQAQSVVVDNGAGWAPLAVGIDYSAEYDFERQALSLQETELSINGVAFMTEGRVTHGESGVVAKLDINSRKIAVADLFNLLSAEQRATLADFDLAGNFSLAAQADYDGRREQPFYYSGTSTVDDLSMSASDISGELKIARALVDFRPDNVRMTIDDGLFDGRPLKGHIVIDDFENPAASGELAGQINLEFLQPFLPPEAGHKPSGRMEFSVKFSGPVADPEQLQFSGDARIGDGAYSSNLWPEVLEQVTCDLYFDNRLTRVNSMSARSQSGQIQFAGRVTDLIPFLLADSTAHISPHIDGNLSGDIDLRVLKSYLSEPATKDLGGRAVFDLQLIGSALSIGTIEPRGQLSLEDAFYRDSLLPEPIEKLTTSLQVTPDVITIDAFAIEFTTSDLSLTGSLRDPFPYLWQISSDSGGPSARPFLEFDVTSHRFNVDQLFPEAVPGSGTNRASLPADSVPPVLMPQVDGRGQFHFDTLIYSEVEFTDITGAAAFADNRIACESVAASVLGGTVEGRTTIDLSDFENPAYAGHFDAQQIEANDFLGRFSSFGGYLFGKINVAGEYDASGWEPEAFLNSLSMDGTALMRQGRLVTTGSVHNALSSLAGQIGEEFTQEQDLNNLDTKLFVKDGRVQLDNLRTSLGRIGDLNLGGWYGFAGGINYEGTILLSNDWSKELLSQGGLLGSLGGFLSDGSVDRVRLPLKVTGTMDSPQVQVDLDAISEQAGDKLRDKGADLLKGLFKKK